MDRKRRHSPYNGATPPNRKLLPCDRKINAFEDFLLRIARGALWKEIRQKDSDSTPYDGQYKTEPVALHTSSMMSHQAHNTKRHAI